MERGPLPHMPLESSSPIHLHPSRPLHVGVPAPLAFADGVNKGNRGRKKGRWENEIPPARFLIHRFGSEPS